ncbi:cell division FtsQ family protein [Mycobacterium kansasii 824]|nr:cell division FtsQ family protein [Mycobacterium kansasii 824]
MTEPDEASPVDVVAGDSADVGAEAVTQPLATAAPSAQQPAAEDEFEGRAGGPGANVPSAVPPRPVLSPSSKPARGQTTGPRASRQRAQTRCARRCSGIEDAAGHRGVSRRRSGAGADPVFHTRNVGTQHRRRRGRRGDPRGGSRRRPGAPGTPLLQIDTSQVADRVAAIRRVASARVQRQYPSALRITIVERVPLVVKDFPDGPHLFDRDGVDFATGPPPPALPYIDVDNPGPTDPATLAALQVLTALRPEVAGQVGRIAAPSVSSITLTLADGRVVIWGTTDRAEEKAEKLAALLTQPGRTYDVSSPDLPTVK